MKKIALAALVAVAALASVAVAQEKFPSHAITFLVPLAPGSSTDMIARLLGQSASKSLGVPVVIENKPGASTMLAISAAAKAPPDGHTIVIGASGLTVNHLLFKSIPYDVERDLTPITLAVGAPVVLVINPSLGTKTLPEFLAKYRDSHELSFASGGAGTYLHLAGEVFKARSGIDMKHVPYRGGSPALTDVIAGHVQLMFVTPVSKPSIDSGDVLALAVSGTTRVDQLPNVPTFAELGFPMPELDAGSWFGILGPAGLPDDVVRLLNQTFNAALKEPATIRELRNIGLVPLGTTPSEFAQFIREEAQRWPPIFARAGIHAE
jgi:tripartite-type tricarboxylate transporter receptor subunit TctC